MLSEELGKSPLDHVKAWKGFKRYCYQITPETRKL